MYKTNLKNNTKDNNSKKVDISVVKDMVELMSSYKTLTKYRENLIKEYNELIRKHKTELRTVNLNIKNLESKIKELEKTYGIELI